MNYKHNFDGDQKIIIDAVVTEIEPDYRKYNWPIKDFQADLERAIKKAETQGFDIETLCIDVYQEDGDDTIVVKGKRLETDDELAQRLKGSIMSFFHAYEEFINDMLLSEHGFYDKEIEKLKNTYPEIYERMMKNYEEKKKELADRQLELIF